MGSLDFVRPHPGSVIMRCTGLSDFGLDHKTVLDGVGFAGGQPVQDFDPFPVAAAQFERGETSD